MLNEKIYFKNYSKHVIGISWVYFKSQNVADRNQSFSIQYETNTTYSFIKFILYTVVTRCAKKNF